MPIRSCDVVRLRRLIEFIYCIKCYLAIKSANELFKISNIFNFYESFDMTKYIHVLLESVILIS